MLWTQYNCVQLTFSRSHIVPLRGVQLLANPNLKKSPCLCVSVVFFHTL
jgi:hypothetical protein